MERFKSAIADFGRRLGFRSLAPGDTGVVDLHFGGYGRIQLEEAHPDALVTLARPWPRENGAAVVEKLLAACNEPEIRDAHPWDIRPGERGGEAMALIARVPLEEFTVQAIEDLVEYFSRALDNLENA